MDLETIDYEKKGHVIRLTLNRPKAFNAMSAALINDLFDAVTEADADRDARVVVITGSGDKAFCAGGDIKEFTRNLDGISKHIKRMTIPLHAAISRLTRMDKVTIGAFNGAVAGAGMGLAMSVDLAIAAERATFTMAYTGIGASPDGGSTFFLPRLIGLRRALEMTLANRRLSSAEALDWGLVNKVVADADLETEVDKIAQMLATGPTLAFKKAKQLLYQSFHTSCETQMEDESQLIAASGETEDFREGVTAFAEKRMPVFKGR